MKEFNITSAIQSCFIVFLVTTLSACGGSGTSPGSGNTGGNLTPTGAGSIATKQALLAAGSTCANGGIELQVGVDSNLNGTLDASEVSRVDNVCNGSDGTNGTNGYTALLNLVNETAGAHCTNGGKLIESGLDSNSDSILSANEVINNEYICNGQNGSNGSNGHNSLINSTSEPAGANCTNGGKRLDIGIDLNDDSSLQVTEITATSYLCADSTSSSTVLQPLFLVGNEPPGNNCVYGGKNLNTGLDSNSNSILDSGEITQTSYLCNGGGILVSTTVEPAGINCTYGGKKLDAGFDANSNTVLDSGEISTSSYLCDNPSDFILWSESDPFSLGYDPSEQSLITQASASMSTDDNGNTVFIASGRGLIYSAILQKDVFTPIVKAVDTMFVSSPGLTVFGRNQLFPTVASASSPSGNHVVTAYARLDYPNSDFNIILSRFDFTDPNTMLTAPLEEIDDFVINSYADTTSQTVSGLKLAVNDANATTAAWVENTDTVSWQHTQGSDLWVNSYIYTLGSGWAWSGAQKLTTSAEVQIQNLLINSTGSSMLIYYNMATQNKQSMSFRYRNHTLGSWLDPGYPTGFTSSDRVLASNIDTSGRVRILYYQSGSLYANYFDMDTQTWASAQALFNAGSLLDAGVYYGPAPNLRVNKRGDIIAADEVGNVYYYDATSASLDKQFLPGLFPLAIDDSGVAMFGKGGTGLYNNGGVGHTIMESVMYYPGSGWAGSHRIDPTIDDTYTSSSRWYFDVNGNTPAVAGGGVFRVLGARDGMGSTETDVGSHTFTGWNLNVFTVQPR